MLATEIPQELVDILDNSVGHKHKREGRVLACLAAILTRYNELEGASNDKATSDR